MAPQLETDAFTTEDGKRLPLKTWPAKGEPKAIMVALHGFNMYHGYFDDPADWWAEQGITTYAYDQRGFGASPDARIWGGSRAMAADARAVLKLVAARHPGVPVYLLGVSMGAAVAVLALSETVEPDLAGVILVAPGLWGGRSMHPMLRFSLWLSAHVMPWNTATGSGLRRRPSDNIPMLRALGKDKLVIRYTRIDAVYGVTQLMGQAYEAAPDMNHPALVLYGKRDEIVPAGPVYDTMQRLPKTPDFALYPGGWHMLLRDLQADVVWRDIAAWIHAPKAPLPSGHQTAATAATVAKE
jgi:alpha-beta hydrolase superfamily lysophospholipase